MTQSNVIQRSASRNSKILLALAAVGCAIALWFFVSVMSRLEAQIEVYLDYTDIPSGLVVTDGLVNKINVRLRGSEMLLRSVTRDRINKPFSLAGIKKGETTVPMGSGELGKNLRGLQVIDVQPPRIVVKADIMGKREVPVKPEVESHLDDDQVVIDIKSRPEKVTISGPESTIRNIAEAPARFSVESISKDYDMDPITMEKRVRKEVTLDLPSLVNANPPKVIISYVIANAMATVTRRCKVGINNGTARQYEIRPVEISLTVDVPESMKNNEQFLRKLDVRITPPSLKVGESKRCKLQITAPDGMTLHGSHIEDVLVTKLAE